MAIGCANYIVITADFGKQSNKNKTIYYIAGNTLSELTRFGNTQAKLCICFDIQSVLIHFYE